MEVRRRALRKCAGDDIMASTPPLRNRSWLADWWLLLALSALLPLLFMAPTLLLGRPLVRDDAGLYFAPQFQALSQSLRQGELYLWNSRQFCGLPVLAGGQSGTLYPPHLLIFRFLPWLTGMAFTYWLHLALALAGFMWVARNMGASRQGALLAAAIYTFSGYQAAHLIHYTIVTTLAHLPLMLAVLQTALTATTRRRAGFWWGTCAVELALVFLCAHPQILLMGLVVCVLWFVTGGWWGDEPAVRAMLRRLPWLAGATVIALLLAMPQLLPMRELLHEVSATAASSGEETVGFMTSYPFRASDLIRIVFGGFYGNVTNAITGSGAAFHETAAFTGGAPLLLALAGLLLLSRRRGYAFLVALLTVGALLMWSVGNPLYLLLARLPLLREFRAAGRWAILPLTSLALLAGLAVGELPRVTDARARTVSSLLTLIAAIGIVLLALLWFTFGSEAGTLMLPGHPGAAVPVTTHAAAIYNFVTSWEPVWFVLALGLTVGAVHLLLRRQSRAAVLVLLLAILVPLWQFWQTLNPTVARDFYVQPPLAARTIADTGGGRVVYLPFMGSGAEPGRPEGPGAGEREDLTPNLGCVYGLSYSDGYVHRLDTPSTLSFWQQYYRYTVQTATGEATSSAETVAAVGTPVERMRKCHKIVAAQYITGAGASFDLLELEKVGEGRVDVYRYREVHPRAWFVREAIITPDPEVQLRTLKQRDFDPYQTAVIDSPVSGLPVALGSGSCRLTADRNQLVEAAVQVDRSGLLVLADAWYPGWRAYIDGKPVPILRADYTIRAVFVPAGAHTVRFQYEPLSLRYGLQLALVGLLLLMVGLVKAGKCKVEGDVEGH